MKKYDSLFQPIKIGNVLIKNRFCVAPMSLGFYVGPNGGYNPYGIDHYVNQAKGGFGLIFTGAWNCDNKVDPIDPQSQNWLENPVVSRKTSIELNNRISAFGSVAFAQVTLGVGRNYASYYAPSKLPVWNRPGKTSPELTVEQIKTKIQCMVQTARGIKDAGYAGIDIHAIHSGYLLDEFAMSVTNKRTDKYGGSLENRLRICKELVEGIKDACGQDFPVCMRLSMKSYLKELGDGLGKGSVSGKDEVSRTLEEAIEIAKHLEQYGYDALSVDTGVYESFYYCMPPMYVKRGYSIEMAAEIKKAVSIPVLLAGRMGDADLAEEAVKAGKIDCVALGRPSLADPDFPKKVEMGVPEKIRPCIACNQGCIHRYQWEHLDAGCAVNPELGHSVVYLPTKVLATKDVLIVGGGVAGMEAARTARKKGHRVSLYEKSNQLGGNLIPAGAHNFKVEIAELNKWYQQEITDLGVEVHLNEELTPEKIEGLHPDVVVLSVGSVPVMPKLPGMDTPKVASCIEVLNREKEIGDKVVVVGGGLVGCEIALECIQEGKDVTIVEALDNILSSGEAVPIENKLMLIDSFDEYQTPILTGYCLKAINEQGAVIESVKDHTELTIPANTVVVAVGFKSLPSMAYELYGKGIEVYETGDGKKVGNILTSIWGAYEVARQI